MHLADFAASDALVHIAVHGDVVALVGDESDLARLADFAHERARMFHCADHRLLDHHMQPFVQRVHRLLVVQGVRRDDNHAVHLYFVEHFAVVVEKGRALQVRESLGSGVALVGAGFGDGDQFRFADPLQDVDVMARHAAAANQS
jgi:hypothetical protein